MLVIGLTGGIGSGKSIVAGLFADHGVPIIDADLIARELTKPNEPAFKAIIDHFGEQVLLEDGMLNRTKLRNIIFSDSVERLWLEKLLHPLIRDEIQKRIRELSSTYCITIVPLLLETDFYQFIHRILVVDAPEHLQIKRAMERDMASKADIEKILKAQMKRQERIARAHDVIVNDGDLKHLSLQVEKLNKIYLEMSNPKSM